MNYRNGVNNYNFNDNKCHLNCNHSHTLFGQRNSRFMCIALRRKTSTNFRWVRMEIVVCGMFRTLCAGGRARARSLNCTQSVKQIVSKHVCLSLSQKSLTHIFFFLLSCQRCNHGISIYGASYQHTPNRLISNKFHKPKASEWIIHCVDLAAIFVLICKWRNQYSSANHTSHKQTLIIFLSFVFLLLFRLFSHFVHSFYCPCCFFWKSSNHVFMRHNEHRSTLNVFKNSFNKSHQLKKISGASAIR